MIRMTLAGLRAYKLRFVATALAVMLGVAFMAGTLIFGDTTKAAMFDQFARTAKNVDLLVQADEPLPPATLDAVGRLPGVAAADGRMSEQMALLDKRNRLVDNGGRPGITLSAGRPGPLRPYDVVSGRAPNGPDETALDADTITRTGYAVGETVTVLDRQQGRHRLTLVGVVSFGTAKEYAGQAVVILTDEAITRLTGATGYRRIVASAAPGVAAGDLARAAGTALPQARVITGDEYREALTNNAINQLNGFLTVLLVFAVIACVVSAFVIYNTFTILVAQRIRELALLRCVGASRRQVYLSVLFEATVVGLVGAALGLGAGLGVGIGLFSGLAPVGALLGNDALGPSLPAHSPVLSPRSIVIGLLLGLVVTVVSATIPALRATRVAPVAALRITALNATFSPRRRVLLIGGAIAVGVVGTLITGVGLSGAGGSELSTVLVVGGGMVNFLAVLIASPLFVGRLTRLLGWLPSRIFGVPARLAVANAHRNPGRTAATTAALMIGVGLMSAATVALATVRATATQQLDQHYPVDYILQPQGGADDGIPADVAVRLRERTEFETVAAVRMAEARLDGNSVQLGTVDPSGQPVLLGSTMTITAGSTTGFGPGSVILFESQATHGKRVGDVVTVSTPTGTGHYRVVALASGQGLSGDAMVAWSDFAILHSSTMDDVVLVRARDGVGPAASRVAVESVTDEFPLVGVSSLAEWRSEITSSVDMLIAVVAALLAVAILIALVGIMNTLSLSVYERTQESALVRALGLTRRQLRATLLAEAVLMGLVAAIVGVTFGVTYGLAATEAIFSGFDAVITIPIGQLLVYVAIAAGAAILAALLPARRAAKASIVNAMAES